MSAPLQTDIDTGSAASRRPLSARLLEAGAVPVPDLVEAMGEAHLTATPLHRVLQSRDMVGADILARALGDGVSLLDRDEYPPDPEVTNLLFADECLAHGVLPWRLVGQEVQLAAASPEGFEAGRTLLKAQGRDAVMLLASESVIHAEIGAHHGAQLVAEAESLVTAEDSCRDMGRAGPLRTLVALTIAAAAAATLWAAPLTFFTAILALATLSLVVSQALKLAAMLASRTRAPEDPEPQAPLPPVTIMVPLFREAEIATALTERIGRLDYPRALLQVLLVLEDCDEETEQVLARTRLPGWCQTVVVPEGTLRTKPRALNYAMRFARGEIIGVLDAEDAPAPDQIRRIVARFRNRGRDVACLQGILDFYNPKANWLSRCFAIEYASWFRLQLPGIARLGLPVPLGGTTVYFRRDVLDEVGGWDAHNVTEDADLGIRLARRGYRTELVPTVTREEANNRALPWIKQRSRWLKGYAMTWAVHSRRPAGLVRDLGIWRALGFQIMFLGALAQFLLAPALWSFWLILANVPHPAEAVLSAPALHALFATYVTAEAVSILSGLIAVARSPHIGLMPWVPSLIFYYPLGTLAAWKAIWEVVTKPFYWDKTQHGKSAPDGPGADLVSSDEGVNALPPRRA
ncbi:Glycosyltransferase, catalytic subunit of cellulose synthase and poly-beta-1,6-N-acetylglucosamine synthase [Roseivivax halotolerans]|uniref:Glycosyltransferase, catalytic subunit of cellulose synthase and poly-beta-1,6-N-acetylglucosamine synthase n=1 Tax=Roseivivax halotolerans TaxID=93684 RepID=A0A1I5YC67_9RHOB|nr:glycosyltransferase family 2 protein [Roseivivax halotolerans]SFQ41825.1 Glycosyltransferase, catalytic subunit of cellulose synthase and poly-beta-1,6-N-acetylglucosamine synthase [Roseivivax halotolerans]